MSHPYNPDQPQPYGPPSNPGPPPSPWGQQPDPGQYGQQPNPYARPGAGQYGPSNPSQYRQSDPYGPPNSAQYGQPQPGQYGQPQPGQYGQYSADPYGQPIPAGWTPTANGRPAKGGRTRGILAAAVAVVVVAGGGISYVAFRDQNGGGGASTPNAAVGTIFSALSKSDLLGVLDSLPPGERSSLHDSFVAQVGQLKRLKVLQSSADANKVAGVSFQTTGLTYAANPKVVNDHVQLVTVTAGKILVNSDASKVPYTKDFLDAAFDGKAPTQNRNQTIDIAAQTRASGEPLRIAVQKVNGKWYPSLMYTVVAASVDGTPTAGDAIPAVGASSADDAVRGFFTASGNQDYRGLIARLDPNEEAALHEYGSLLLRHAPSRKNLSLNLGNFIFADTDVPGGTRVALKGVKFTENGQTSSVTIDGQCAVVDAGGRSTRYCASQALDRFGSNLKLTATERAALTDLFAAIPKIGFVATKSGGKWFVSPIRTLANLDISILSNLKDNDLLTLIKLARRQ